MDINDLRMILFGPPPARRVREYPNGRAGPEDEGATSMAIAADHRYKMVKIVFERPMNWIGLDQRSATKLRDDLTTKINELWPPPAAVENTDEPRSDGT